MRAQRNRLGLNPYNRRFSYGGGTNPNIRANQNLLDSFGRLDRSVQLAFIGSGTLLTVSALATFTRVHRETLDHIDRESQRFHSNPRSMGTAHGDMIHGPRNTNPGPLRRCTNCVCL